MNNVIRFIVSMGLLVLISHPVYSKGLNSSGTVKDVDGIVYYTVKIGNQVWMAENLKTTHYNDGTAIPLVTNGTEWVNLSTPGYCWYNNSIKNRKTYGALYNWYAVNTGKLAQAGWHVPSNAEWDTLQNYLVLNGYNWDGSKDTATNNKIAKSLAAKTDWFTDTITGTVGYDLTKNNGSGFSALPGGLRFSDGAFYYRGGSGGWWSATEEDATLAWYRNLLSDLVDLRMAGLSKSCGISVRLLRN